jgi:hypothetical protein
MVVPCGNGCVDVVGVKSRDVVYDVVV